MDERRAELIREIEENLKPKEEHLIYLTPQGPAPYSEIHHHREMAKRHIGLRCRFIPCQRTEVQYGTIVGTRWDRARQELFYRIRPDGQKKTITKKLFSKELQIL